MQLDLLVLDFRHEGEPASTEPYVDDSASFHEVAPGCDHYSDRFVLIDTAGMHMTASSIHHMDHW